MRINSKYKYPTTPKANEKAIVQGDKFRFTILTSRLFRVEYNENGVFEDRATQIVINRDFEVPEFTVSDKDGLMKIATKDIQITYTKTPLTANSLTVCYIGGKSGIRAGAASNDWSFKMENSFNMKGTARTLDTIDGECELEQGIITRGEITYIDDSNSLIIAEDGVIEKRTEKCDDVYVFCYGETGKHRFDYIGCLHDYYLLTGKTPLIPRYALGNWWSRYYEYTQNEYTELMKRFKREDIPFSVAVIDMDWHYVNVDPKYCSGWTGYTWNKELFPDHKAFLKFLKDEGLHTTLNLHPQEGINSHEDAYPAMAEAMGIDPATEKRVEFDITDPKFIENYFSKVHHPLEKEGVDFWWMDWQQGNTTRVEGLDPLWMLNHYHYIDNGNQDRRPLLFSRYSGPGSHRYPLGFSGDTVVTWESLDFQPYFTATASNIGYTWWSHDIGGHMCGYRDEELITRWFQLGVFSPINRLHSSKAPFQGKEPWKYNKISELSMHKFLKLRHELIPYLYSMNYRTFAYDEPLVQPLYYKYTSNDRFGVEIYKYKNEYSFGTEMLVSPITSPHDNETMLGSVDTYLPEGMWYDFFTNTRYKGNRSLKIYRSLDDMPVFVKAGGIIPMAKLQHVNDTENPESMKIKVYAGESNTFEMYEDDGVSMAFEKGKSAITKFVLDWNDNAVFRIEKAVGDLSVIPAKRDFEIEFIGIEDCEDIAVTIGEKICDFEKWYDNGVLTVKISNADDEVCVQFNSKPELRKNDINTMLAKLLERAETSNKEKDDLYHRLLTAENPVMQLSLLATFKASEDLKNALIEILSSDTI